MTHWKSMTDRQYLGAFDLPKDRDVPVTIARVVKGSLVQQGGQKSTKPIVYFEGKERGLVANATNCKTIARLYGNEVEQWTGKRIALYVTTTSVGGETMDCIRVRPTVPTGTAKPRVPGFDDVEREPGSEG